MQRKILWGLAWALISIPTFAQTVLTADEAVAAALKNSPAIKASGLVVRQNELLVRSARNIPNLDLTIDSPSGTFYTLGVQQNFRFPTVYIQQAKLQKQQIILAQKEKIVTENDLKYRIRTAYLNMQYADAYLKQLQSQDSIYAQIAIAAKRNYDVGTIDKLALIFAETQAADLRNQVAMATQELMVSKGQLSFFTNIPNFNVSQLIVTSNAALSVDPAQNPLIEAAKQVELINQKTIEVEKANALPGFMAGYYNQGSRKPIWPTAGEWGEHSALERAVQKSHCGGANGAGSGSSAHRSSKAGNFRRFAGSTG